MSAAVMSVSGQNLMRYFSYIVLYILRSFLQKYGRISLNLTVSNSDKYYVCHEFGGWSLAFQLRGTVSIPDPSMWELRWKNDTLENISLCVLYISPVSIIQPLFHTHPSIYHPRCIMFFSQYFRFPLSVSFHHCSILIHPSTTHAV